MSLSEAYATPVARGALGLSRHSLGILLAGAALMAASALVTLPGLKVIFGVASGSVLSLLLVVRCVAALARQHPGKLVKGFAEHDPTPGLLTNAEGEVLWHNQSAKRHFSCPGPEDNLLYTALSAHFANPTPIIFRQLTRAQNRSFGSEELETKNGRLRIKVHRVADIYYFWRLDDVPAPASVGIGLPELPILNIENTGKVLSVNQAAHDILGGGAQRFKSILHPSPMSPGAQLDLSGPEGPVPLRIISVTRVENTHAVAFVPLEHGRNDSDEQFYDTLPVALLHLDVNGNVKMANRLARHLLDIEGAGAQLGDLVEGLGRSVLDWVHEVAHNRTASRVEVLRVRRDDRELFVQISLKRIIADGTPGIMAVLHDATELKTLEAQFVQSQKMQAIGQLAGGIAHDFNNLLTAISGHCDLLLLRHDAADPDFSDLMQINQNANRAASLVGQLLAFSRKQTLKLEPVDLHDTLTDLTHLLNRLVGERVRLSVSHDPSLTPIRADKRQLEQVIMNLVVNARDAMPDGGEIRIQTAQLHLEDELRRDRANVAPGDYVLVRVSDDGVGIPKDKLIKVFEPFYTTKGVGEGTGLGLSTAYGIVKQSGGFIFVDSTPGSGTCFTLYFPAHCQGQVEHKPEPDAPMVLTPPVAVPSPAAHEVGTEPRSSEGVVLLVEDEAPVRAFASRALRMRGYTVLEAENAEQALDTLKDERIEVDVFVTDVVMPGMDGPSWVRKALETRPDTRVVFVSGYAEEDFADNQARIPNSVFLPKPFSLGELTSTVREQLH